MYCSARQPACLSPTSLCAPSASLPVLCRAGCSSPCEQHRRQRQQEHREHDDKANLTMPAPWIRWPSSAVKSKLRGMANGCCLRRNPTSQTRASFRSTSRRVHTSENGRTERKRWLLATRGPLAGRVPTLRLSRQLAQTPAHAGAAGHLQPGGATTQTQRAGAAESTPQALTCARTGLGQRAACSRCAAAAFSPVEASFASPLRHSPRPLCDTRHSSHSSD